MAFPTDPTDLDIEMNLAGTWTNLRTGGFVLDRGITITRGRSDEAGQVSPSALSMTLNNTDGRFSPRNPTGPYYGVLGRNTPIRASVRRGSNFLETLGGAADEATAPDATALGITGDIDVRLDLTTDAWGSRNLCGKYERTGNQLSWILQTGPDGSLRLAWTTAGTPATAAVAISTVGVPMYPGRLAVRATLDVDNGAGSNATTFYTAPTIAGPWTQLGATVVGATGTTGVTSIFDSTAPIEVGHATDQTLIIPISFAQGGGVARPVVGRINAFELRNGIGGTVVANPNFTAQTAGVASFADTATTPNTWTMQGNTVITNRRWRFYGELATIPPQWDTSGKDVYASVEANGVLRRLRQASSPLSSPIRRSLAALPNVAYWPCEDASGATSIASAVQGQRPMILTGAPSFASSDVFGGSASLPLVAKSRWTGNVPSYTPTGLAQVMFYVQVPAGQATNTTLARVTLAGTGTTILDHINVIYLTDAGGSITWNAFDQNGATVWASGNTFSGLNGVLLRISVELTQNGANIDAECGVDVVGVASGGGLIASAAGMTLSRVTSVVVSPNSDVDQVTLGQISVGSTIIDRSLLDDQAAGFIGEAAGRRVERLCAENGVGFRGIGNLDDTEAMGVQKVGIFTDLIQECADADMGMLYEPRDMLGIGYRTRNSLSNQPAHLALDYEADQVSGALDPTDDDQQIRNDVTVSRDNGSSFRVQQTDGRMSVNPPPNGVGLYDDSVSVNVQTDDQLPDQAGWRVHVGTVDEARYPVIGTDFTSAGIVGNAALNDALLSLEVGDRVTVTNPPPWLPPDDISQLVQGTSESYGNFQHSMSLNCSPESPYRVAVLDDGIGRLDTDGSQLAAGVNATATTLSVTVTAGPLWTTSAADWPFDIVVGGEVMTVTAISGTSSPQTFTVTRSVNGVAKAQVAGQDVRLAHPTFISF